MDTLSLFVKSKRKLYHLTQEEFAAKCGLDVNFVRDVENEKVDLSMDKASQLLQLISTQFK